MPKRSCSSPESENSSPEEQTKKVRVGSLSPESDPGADESSGSCPFGSLENYYSNMQSTSSIKLERTSVNFSKSIFDPLSSPHESPTVKDELNEDHINGNLSFIKVRDAAELFNNSNPDSTNEKFDSSEDEDEEERKFQEASAVAEKDPLRVFQILDQVDNEGDGGGSDKNNSDNESEEEEDEDDLSDDEIEAMLEEKLEESGVKKKVQDGPYFGERKIVRLIELGHNHFDLLPEGWVQVFHKSGMPVYLHRPSRVCTFSRPYYLGQGSVKKHLVPLSAIPCFSYRKALDQEKALKEEEAQNPNAHPESRLLTARIETAEDNKASQSLGPFQLQHYCSKLFRFKTEKRLLFSSWADRRNYLKSKKMEKCLQRPSLPDGTKLIKFPIRNPDEGPDAKPRGEWIINPNGKSYICILHEYVQHALKKQPTYEFKALENPSTPYSATVIINGMKYGSGTGTSKKQAKLAAAKASLEILIPDVREKMPSTEVKKSNTDEDRFSIFDEIKIEDPRIPEFCAKATEPSPYSILLTCLQRNFGLQDTPIDFKTRPINRQFNEFTMTVGKHTAKVICKNKKDGKQKASQKLLQVLHPHITSWGSLLRLYGNVSMKNVKEKKQEEHEVTVLQNKASVNSPNYAILEKLKEEMMKLHNAANERIPIGIFIPPEDYCLPSSGTELSKVDLFGFVGELSPRCIIPTEIKCPRSGKIRSIFEYSDETDLYSLLVEFIHKLFFKKLLVSPKERHIVVVESLLSPIVIKETLAKVLFLHFEVPSVLYVPSHLMAICTLGVNTALVVDVGYHEVQIIPMYEGVPVLSAWQAQPIAGQAIEERLRGNLSNHLTNVFNAGGDKPGVVLNIKDVDDRYIEDIKVRTCFVTTYARGEEIAKGKVPPEPPSVEYRIGGTDVLTIPGAIRESAFEVLFEKDGDQLSLPNLILDSVLKCSIDAKKPLLENLLIVGGTSMAPGFKSRLMSEIKALLKSPYYSDRCCLETVKMLNPPAKANYTCWLGGAVFGATDMIPLRAMTREKYLSLKQVPDWSNLAHNTLISLKPTIQ